MEKLSDLLGYLVLLFIFVVLPAILNRLAKKRAAQAQQRRAEEGPAEERPAEADEPEQAPTSQVERYLETLGIKVERRPAPQQSAPARQPQPPPTLRPEPAPAQARTVYEARPAEVKQFLDQLQGHITAPRPAPPQPRRVRVAAPAPRPAPQPEAEGPPPSAAPTPTPARPLGVLGHRPTRSDLQKAVILGEIIRRHDFDHDPFDRLIL